MEIKSIKRKNRRCCAGRILICGLIGIQACFLFSCEDGLKNGVPSGYGLKIKVSGIEEYNALTTRAQLEPQTVVVTASDGAIVEFTLSVDTAATTRSSSAMTAGKQYRVILFNKDFSKRTGSEADGPNKSFLCTAGTEAKLSVPWWSSSSTDPDRYVRVVAYSINEATDPDDRDIDESDASYTVDPQYDYLYFVSDPIDLTDTSPEANIVFKRGTTRIQTEVRVYHYGYGTAPDPDPDVAPPEYIYGLSDDFTYTISPNNAVQQTFATASPPIATSTPANAVTPPTWNIDYRTNANYRDYSVCSDDGHTVFTGSSSPLSISLSGKIQLYDGNTVYNHYEGIYYTDGYVPIKTNTTSFTGALSAGYNYKLKINISGYDATSL